MKNKTRQRLGTKPIAVRHLGLTRLGQILPLWLRESNRRCTISEALADRTGEVPDRSAIM